MAENNDLEQVQAFLREEIARATQEELAKLQKAQPKEQKIDTSRAEFDKQLKDLIDPIVQPALQEARLTAASAMDYARFYSSNPDAVEYKDDIEELFKKGVESGRAVDRESLASYVLGQKLRKDPEAVMKKFQEKQAQIERAKQGIDFGNGSGGVQRQVFDPVAYAAMSDEQQLALLGDVEF